MKHIFLVALPLIMMSLLVLRGNAAAAGGQVVISEVMYGMPGSGNADQEYIELYNPSNIAVEMVSWRITRQAANNINETILISSLNGTIPAYGYFLIAHPEYTGASPDVVYSNSGSPLTLTSTVNLYSDAQITLLDKVGYGETTMAESVAAPGFEAGTAIQRKAVATSTTGTMAPGGVDELLGNGYDSDNNASDFVVSAPEPQTSLSPSESPAVSPTPTPSPTPEASPSPTPTPPPSPTPSPSPVPSPSPDPTPTPSPTPEASPSPTPTPPPSPTPSLSPVPSPSPDPEYGTPRFRMIFCRLAWVDTGAWWGRTPVIRCQWR